MSLFEYMDYRDLLRDFYLKEKTEKSWYSFRAFANRAELASPNYLKLVMDGRRRITDRTIDSFIKGLRLNANEAKYFRTLVNFNQSPNTEFKKLYLTKLQKLRKNFSLIPVIAHDSRDILQAWYHWVVREMVLLKDFSPNPFIIAKRLQHRITPRQAKESLELLERLKFVKGTTTGYVLTQPMISTTHEIPSGAIRALHHKFLDLALEAINNLPITKRMVNGVTVALPASRLAEVREKIRNFCQEIGQMSDENLGNDEVHHLQINFFPLTDRGSQDEK